jgi:hypothetical protein
MPAFAACQAASDPAIPPPMMFNISVMLPDLGQKARCENPALCRILFRVRNVLIIG